MSLYWEQLNKKNKFSTELNLKRNTLKRIVNQAYERGIGDNTSSSQSLNTVYWEQLNKKNKFPEVFKIKKESLKQIVNQAYERGMEETTTPSPTSSKNPIFDLFSEHIPGF